MITRLTLHLTVLLLLLFLAACGGNDNVPPANQDSDVARGERIFKQNCTSCHSAKPDTTVVGPSLSGIASRAGSRVEGLSSRDYIHMSITKPSAYVVDGFVDQMPSNFGKTLTGEELDRLISYLLTLK